MSNKIHFEPTKYKSVRTGSITYGCRIWDDGNATYTNTWECIPDDDMDVISKCIADFSGSGPFNTPDDFSNMMNCVEEEEDGVYVGDEWYEWEQIKHFFQNK